MRRQRDSGGLRSVFLIRVISKPLRRSAKGRTGYDTLAPQLENLPVPTDERAYDVTPTALPGKDMRILILTLHGQILLRRLPQWLKITGRGLRQIRQVRQIQ